MSVSDAQNEVICYEILSILAEQKALQQNQIKLQERLEELLVTLQVKKQFQSSTPPKPILKYTSRIHEDDLEPAPIGDFEGDTSTFGTESGWERDTLTPLPNSGVPNGSSLSLSYSFTPLGADYTQDISHGLSPAPLQLPTNTGESKAKGAPNAAGDILGTDVVASAASAISAATLRLFGSPKRETQHLDDNSPYARSPSTVLRPRTVTAPEESEDEEDDEDDEDDSTVKMESSSDYYHDTDDSCLPSPAKKIAVSAEDRAAREASASSMTMSALSHILTARLVEAGVGSSAKGLKDTVIEACQLLGVTFTGNLKKDATACYVLSGPLAAPHGPPSPIPSSRRASAFLTGMDESETESASAPAPTPAPHSQPPTATTPVQPAKPAAYTIFSPTSSSSFSSRLREFYREHNPGKMGEVDKIAAAFTGREAALIAKLENLYKAKFPL